MPKLCSFGCKPTELPTHRFPDPDKFPEQFKAWVALVGGKLQTASDYEYYRKRIICDKHFTNSDKNRHNRLNRLAVPSLNLNEQLVAPISHIMLNEEACASNVDQVSAPSVMQARAPTPDTDELVTASRSHVKINKKASNSIIDQASTSSGLPATVPTPKRASRSPLRDLRHQYRQRRMKSRPFGAGEFWRRPPTLSMPFSSINGLREISRDLEGPSQDAAAATRARVIMEHNYTVQSKIKWARIKDGLKAKPVPVYNSLIHPLRTKIKRLRTEITRLRKKGRSFEARLANAENLATNVAFQNMVKNMTKPAQLFLNMQKQTSKNAKGRRFTTEQKILALSLYKKSPKCYALLHKYFTLPSAKAMKRLLSRIKLHPGINPIIFKKIKKTVSKENASDRLCSLIFDEMSLTPQVFYNNQKDELEGFATNQKNMFANHALVFMVKGVKNNFKQPIAYYFTSGLTKFELKNILKSVIKHAQNSGLIIVNTVCDQSSVNTGAIAELVNDTKAKYMRLEKEWRYEMFSIDGQNIIPIYDTPHLIKGIRNNLITKDMHYTTNKEKKVVKWNFYEMLYAADQSFGELRLVDKLTEEHVNPLKIKKMRVKLATQLFSHSVAVAAEHLSARGDLPAECRQLIDITIMLDNLFDSLNVNSFCIPNGKKYKGPIRRNSPHHQLWKDCKEIIKTIKFIKKVKTNDGKIRFTETTIPSVINLIKTIEGMEEIWKLLSQKYGFDTLLSRHFNQDPIEIFFGNIRSYGARNNAPNTVAFEAAFKALLLNNYNSPHSSKANCEEDSNVCLQTFDFFSNEKRVAPDVPLEDEIECNAEVFITGNFGDNDAGQRNYVCGWVLTKCLKYIVKSCHTCRENLIDGQDTNKKNDFIKCKDYSAKKWLCYPSEEFVHCLHDVQNITISFLKKNVPLNNVKKNIIRITDVLVDYPFQCSQHKEILRSYFTSTTVNVIIHSWCRADQSTGYWPGSYVMRVMMNRKLLLKNIMTNIKILKVNDR